MLDLNPLENTDWHGPDKPNRPARDLRSTLANPDVHLMNKQDIEVLNARRSLSGSVTWPCTPLVEASRDGSRLEGMAYAGLAISVTDRRRHTVFVGATGSGKTYNVALPLLAAMLEGTNESGLFTNLRGPAGTAEIRAIVNKLAPDAEVIVFAPGSRFTSVACNYITVARNRNLLDLLVRHICSTIPKGSQDSPFWEKAAMKKIKAALRHPQIVSIAALHELLSDPEVLEALAKKTGDPDLKRSASFDESGANGATSGIDAVVRVAPFDQTEDVRAVISGKSELDPGELLESGRRFVLIVEANENDFENALHVIGAFFTLFFACAVQAAEKNGGVLARPVSAFLDEFGIIPAIPNFHQTANLGRSRGFAFHVFVQSLEQIMVTYGANAGAVMAALCTKVFLCSGLGATDRAYASLLAGLIAVQEWRECQQLDPHTDQWLPATRSSQVSIRPLIAADDLLLRPHSIFGGYAYVFLVDQLPAIVHFTSSFEIPIIADSIQSARNTPPIQRANPLPLVSTTRLVDSISGNTETTKTCGIPAGITDYAGWTDGRIRERLEQVKIEALEWEATTGSARKWWCAFQDENKHRIGLVLRLAEELANRKATITEFFLAYLYSNTDNVQANMCYLDYTRLKKQEEQKKRESAASQTDRAAPVQDAPSDPSPKKGKRKEVKHHPTTKLVRCASCRSLGPASASTCRLCGHEFPKR